MEYTQMELKVLNILADEHGSEWQTEDDEHAQLDTFLLTTDGTGDWGTIFGNHQLDPKVYRGVISSLLQKGALEEDEYTTVPKGSSFTGRKCKMIAIAIKQEPFNAIRGAA